MYIGLNEEFIHCKFDALISVQVIERVCSAKTGWLFWLSGCRLATEMFQGYERLILKTNSLREPGNQLPSISYNHNK